MKKLWDRIFTALITVLTVISLLSLGFVLYFIIKEALPVFREVSLADFLFGQRWSPVSLNGPPAFGIFNLILGTVYVSFLAMVIAMVIGLGTAVFLSCVATERVRSFLLPFIDLLAGIPSVVYGFVGLNVLVKYFIRLRVHTGTCVLAASIVLAIMLLPYLVSACTETIQKQAELHLASAEALGLSKWYAISAVILPASRKNILLSMILAVGRAMGETMAVMMVMGNANLFPKLLGKGESIAALIALETGSAVAGSTHYHALFAAGMVLMVLVFIINTVISVIRNHYIR